jgi:hypothetical protein
MYDKKILQKRLKTISMMIDIQKQDGNWNYNEYLFGMLNGMLFIESIIKGVEPKFLDPPKKWLRKKWYQRMIDKIIGKKPIGKK